MKNKRKLSLENIILFLYFFLTPFEDLLNFGFGTLNRYLAIIYIAIVFLSLFRSNSRINLKDKIIWYIILILIIPLFSMLWAFDRSVSFSRNLSYVLYPLMFLVSYIRGINRSEFKVLKYLIAFSAFSLAAYMLIFNRVLLFEGRAVITDDSGPNGLAAHLVLGFFITIDLMYGSRLFKKILLLFSTFLILFVILMTGSRGALLAFSIGLVAYFIMNYKKNKRYKTFITLAIFTAAFIIILSYLPEYIFLRLFGDNAFTRDFDSSMGRTVIWIDSIRYLIPNRPILGYGSGNAAIAMESIRGYYMVSHNTFLQMVVEYGILMLPVFIILVIKVYKKVLKNKKYSFALASFITMMIIAFFLSSYAFKFFWNVLMFMGLIIAMEKIESEVKVVG